MISETAAIIILVVAISIVFIFLVVTLIYTYYRSKNSKLAQKYDLDYDKVWMLRRQHLRYIFPVKPPEVHFSRFAQAVCEKENCAEKIEALEFEQIYCSQPFHQLQLSGHRRNIFHFEDGVEWYKQFFKVGALGDDEEHWNEWTPTSTYIFCVHTTYFSTIMHEVHQ